MRPEVSGSFYVCFIVGLNSWFRLEDLWGGRGLRPRPWPGLIVEELNIQYPTLLCDLTCCSATREFTNIQAVNLTCPLVLVHLFLFFSYAFFLSVLSPQYLALSFWIVLPFLCYIVETVCGLCGALEDLLSIFSKACQIPAAYGFDNQRGFFFLYGSDTEFHQALAMSINTLFVFLFKDFQMNVIQSHWVTHTHTHISNNMIYIIPSQWCKSTLKTC